MEIDFGVYRRWLVGKSQLAALEMCVGGRKLSKCLQKLVDNCLLRSLPIGHERYHFAAQ